MLLPHQDTYPAVEIEASPHSREDFPFDDLIEKQPGWLLRSGIVLMFGATALFVGLAAVIRYPDKLAAPFVLTTENPPIELLTVADGQIEEILYPFKKVWGSKNSIA